MQKDIPLRYIEPVFRPPSEAHSLILPLTNGCSWSKCIFCEMYTAPQKKFFAFDEQATLRGIEQLGKTHAGRIRRIFLADGDAMMLSTRRLLVVLRAIARYLPEVQRISSYCLPRNLRKKTVQELIELREAGLTLAYVGAESGNDFVLQRVNKGETFASTQEALDKLGAARIKRSVMILNGLGGKMHSQPHALDSARLANATQPEYLATLVVSFPDGEKRFRSGFPEWEALAPHALFAEMETFLDALHLQRTIFRSDHASNWLVLKGTLGADKARLLSEVRTAIATPHNMRLRPAWARGL